MTMVRPGGVHSFFVVVRTRSSPRRKPTNSGQRSIAARTTMVRLCWSLRWQRNWRYGRQATSTVRSRQYVSYVAAVRYNTHGRRLGFSRRGRRPVSKYVHVVCSWPLFFICGGLFSGAGSLVAAVERTQQ